MSHRVGFVRLQLLVRRPSDRRRKRLDAVEMKTPSFLIFVFLSFFFSYIKKRLTQAFFHFESAKDFLVENLYRQRGKLVRPFLHSGMAGLVIIGILLAPVIKSAIPQEERWGEAEAMVLREPATLDQALTTQISVKPREAIVVYQVRTGDTLSEIAEKFGVTLDTLRWQNDLESVEAIKPGQLLEIPPVAGVVHKVKRGETIYSIAKRYDVDAQLIVNWPFNDFADDETFALNTGQLLVVPEGVMPQVKPWEARRYVAYRVPAAGTVTGTGQFVWPASGEISQYPVWYHMAVDIANKAVPDILAADSGQVIACNYFKWGYGYHVIIDHGNGFQTLYGHLNSIYVNPGQSIGRGQALGRMGCTGRCSGTHLHFEIRRGGVLQNPLNYLK